MVLTTHLFLLSNGLSAARAPFPRERFLGFALLGSSVALILGAPAAALMGAVALAAHARENNHRQRVAGAWPRPHPWRVPPAAWPADTWR